MRAGSSMIPQAEARTVPPEPAGLPAREEGMVLLYLVTRPVQTGSVSRIPDPPAPAAAGRPLKVFVMKSFCCVVHPAAGQPVGRPNLSRPRAVPPFWGRRGLRPRAGDPGCPAPGAAGQRRLRLQHPAPGKRGSLRSEQIQIRSGGDIRQYRLKREEVRNGRTYITLVADYPGGRADLPDPALRQDFDAGACACATRTRQAPVPWTTCPPISRRLFETWRRRPRWSHAQWLTRTCASTLSICNRIAAPSRRSGLSLRTDSRYLVLGSIDDLSLEPQGSTSPAGMRIPKCAISPCSSTCSTASTAACSAAREYKGAPTGPSPAGTGGQRRRPVLAVELWPGGGLPVEGGGPGHRRRTRLCPRHRPDRGQHERGPTSTWAVATGSNSGTSSGSSTAPTSPTPMASPG